MQFLVYKQQADSTFELTDTVVGELPDAQAAAGALPPLGAYQIQVETTPGVFEIVCSIVDGAQTWQPIEGGI